MKIPPQYNRLMPYLIVPNAGKFIEFMKHVFGATEQISVPGEAGAIMHGEIRLGECVIMLAEASLLFSAKPAGMFVYVEKVKELYEKAIAAGAVSIMEPVKKEYGYTCGFTDPFGNDWWPTEV
ncbi:MAG: VOC family protein [Bacteroidota bacterium]